MRRTDSGPVRHPHQRPALGRLHRPSAPISMPARPGAWPWPPSLPSCRRRLPGVN